MSPEDSAKLQEDLDRISAWMKTWLMEINIPKSHHLTLGAECSSASYSIGPTPLAQSTVERDLGIMVDHKLTFSDHYELAIKQATLVQR
jgi:hypothetical protein